MSFLDRINIGTAKLAGLGEDLNMTPGQFNNVTVILFASYVCEWWFLRFILMDVRLADENYADVGCK